MAKTSKCCTCGYEWETGKDGSHMCQDYLRIEIARLNKVIADTTPIIELEQLTKYEDATGEYWVEHIAADRIRLTRVEDAADAPEVTPDPEPRTVARLDRHTICNIGWLFWDEDKQCYSADAVYRKVKVMWNAARSEPDTPEDRMTCIYLHRDDCDYWVPDLERMEVVLVDPPKELMDLADDLVGSIPDESYECDCPVQGFTVFHKPGCIHYE